jgi:hypothetical protein
VVDKPMLEKSLFPSSDKPDFLCENPCERTMPDQSVCEQQDVSSKLTEFPEHKQVVGPNLNIKSTSGNPSKQSKKNQDMRGFNNKRVGRLISRSLRNRSKAHVSSIESIEVHESSDSEIEKFLADEDPNYSKPDLSQTFDYVNNLPPCLKHNKDFPGIKLSQRPTMDGGSVLTHSHVLPRTLAPAVNCEVCLHWIGLYYTDIPVLQEKIKALTAQNDSLTIENCELKISAQRQGKHLKRTGNVIIKNIDCVKAVINSEIL